MSYHKNHPIPEKVALRAASNYAVDNAGCWITGYTKNPAGYGMVSSLIPGEKRRARLYLAHRAAWTHHNGPIPDGLVIDHKCFNKSCVNPDHLRLLTRAQNNARKVAFGEDWPLDECRHGHPMSMQIMRGKKIRRRECAGCLKDRNDRTTARRKAEREQERAA